jgi:hypothetical protein
LGQRRGLKNPWARQEDVFLVHPQNGLNGLILNWCIGGCCFTPAHPQVSNNRHPMDGVLMGAGSMWPFLHRFVHFLLGFDCAFQSFKASAEFCQNFLPAYGQHIIK